MPLPDIPDEYFPHETEYHGQKIRVPKEEIIRHMRKLVEDIQANVQIGQANGVQVLGLRNSRGGFKYHRNPSMYTGALGVSHMFWALWRVSNTASPLLIPKEESVEWLNVSLAILQQCDECGALQRSLDQQPDLSHCVGYYFGDAGLHTLACQIHTVKIRRRINN